MEALPARPPEVILYGKTRAEVAKKAGAGVKRGKYGAVSEILHVRDGYAAKATLIVRPEPKRRAPNEPLPMWARVLVRLAWAVAGILMALALVIAALSALVGSLVNLPWMTILGAAVVILFLLLCFAPTRNVITVIVKVFV
jgi:anti-sigma factor RsiW